MDARVDDSRCGVDQSCYGRSPTFAGAFAHPLRVHRTAYMVRRSHRNQAWTGVLSHRNRLGSLLGSRCCMYPGRVPCGGSSPARACQAK